MAEIPYPISPYETYTTQSMGEGLLSVLADMAGQLTALEKEGRELTENYRHLDEQVRLASQVQRDFLPDAGLHVHGARLRTLFRPIERVSGDFCDIARLDETHVAISIADAAGHGVPAALLTMFIKQSFRGKEAFNGSYRIVPPAELLSRLSRDIIEANLTHCRFVTALHAVYDEANRRLTFARGGAPFPILIPADGRPRQLPSRGGLVGAFAAADFETIEITLRAGDRVLFFTDGLNSLFLGRDCKYTLPDIAHTPWFAEAARYPTPKLLAEINRHADEAAPTSWHGDDITIITLEIVE